jgi:predicted ATP-grasp superfamily ATP-dependent carboligase
MNMFYTGLGIARSLGMRGIPVVGLSAHRGCYGNFTRYANVLSCPDSRKQPEALLEFLLQLGKTMVNRAIIFPTRDDDVLFLERFRDQLRSRFLLVLPETPALTACLNKWETYRWAEAAGVPGPRCWSVAAKDDLLRIVPEVSYPCVLKPVSAHHWRGARNWQLVGSRKVIAASSREELLAEYDKVSQADARALVQEFVPGGDDCLRIAACYMDRNSRLVAGFTAEKVLQEPEGFGTGCIVKATDSPEVLAVAGDLLAKMHFSGIAEVEFKWDRSSGQHKLIEINPRPWDQHRLGSACGVDLIHIAYCDLTGLDLPRPAVCNTAVKWVAEDVFLFVLLRSMWKRDGSLRALLRMARGRRTYAIGSRKDPLPLLVSLGLGMGPELAGRALSKLRSMIGRLLSFNGASQKRTLSYDNQLRKAKCKD